MQVLNPQTLSLLGFIATQAPMLVTLRSHSKVSDHLQLLIFVAATSFYHRLIVNLAPVDACVVKRYKTSCISQRVTHKSSKCLQNVARVSLFYVDKLDWNLKRFCGLGPSLKILQNLISVILDRSGLILDWSSLADSDFLFSNQLELKAWNIYLWAMSNTYTRHVLFSNCQHIQKNNSKNLEPNNINEIISYITD